MGDVIEVSWADVLEEEGIFKRGYGSIPKYAMLDPTLHITSKAIYAYFCACAGSGTTTFPGRDTVLFHLSINKTTYYKYYEKLKEDGYISVRKAAPRPGQGSRFTHNIHTIESNPKRFSEDPRFKKPGVRETIAFEGIKSAGYGMIPRMVMEDPRISAKAKALYAYLASYTGGGKSAFPEVKKTLYFLQISHSTYKTLLKELVNVNYVVVIQRRVSGRMGVNDYYLVTNPSIANVGYNMLCKQQKATNPLPKTKMMKNLQKHPQDGVGPPQVKIWDTEISDIEDPINPENLVEERISPRVNFSDTEISHAGKQDMEGQDAEESDTEIQYTRKSHPTINNSAINSSSTLNPISHSLHKPTPLCDWLDSMDRKELEEEIKDKMGFFAVEQGLVKYSADTYEMLISLVVDTLSSKEETIRIGGQLHDREEVADRLYDLVYWEYEFVIESVGRVSHEIKNLSAYWLTSLFNAKDKYRQKTAREIAKELG